MQDYLADIFQTVVQALLSGTLHVHDCSVACRMFFSFEPVLGRRNLQCQKVPANVALLRWAAMM